MPEEGKWKHDEFKVERQNVGKELTKKEANKTQKPNKKHLRVLFVNSEFLQRRQLFNLIVFVIRLLDN